MTSGGNGHLYVVDCSGLVLQHLQQLQQQASKAGKGEGFLAAMGALYDHLRKDPMVSASQCIDCPRWSSQSVLASCCP